MLHVQLVDRTFQFDPRNQSLSIDTVTDQWLATSEHCSTMPLQAARDAACVDLQTYNQSTAELMLIDDLNRT
jgi:hypothetical protein